MEILPRPSSSQASRQEALELWMNDVRGTIWNDIRTYALIGLGAGTTGGASWGVRLGLDRCRWADTSMMTGLSLGAVLAFVPAIIGSVIISMLIENMAGDRFGLLAFFSIGTTSILAIFDLEFAVVALGAYADIAVILALMRLIRHVIVVAHIVREIPVVRARDRDRRLYRAAVRTLTGLAMVIGGSQRIWRSEEFFADMAIGNDPATGLGSQARLEYSAGLVIAAFRFRGRDLARLIGRTFDFAISWPFGELLVGIVAFVTARYYADQRGLDGLMDHAHDFIVIVGAACGLLKYARWQRSIRPCRHPAKKNRNSSGKHGR